MHFVEHLKMKKVANPFITTGYHSPKYFCDRNNETAELIKNIENGINTTLISIRRMGKTGLIKHLFYQLQKDWKCIYIDILPTESLEDFLNLFATAIINSIPEKENFGQKVYNFIKTLRPVVSYDALTNSPQVSFNIGEQEAQKNIQTIIQFLKEQPDNIVIAIDEFQQITNYTETNIEAWFRTIIQEAPNVRFIFSGSRQHLMNELFTSPSRPFYRSTTLMSLDQINDEAYTKFIFKHFSDNKISIEEEVIKEVLQWTNRHTYYVQLLCNRVFSTGNKIIVSSTWKETAQKLLKEEEQLFFNYRNLLTKPQWNLFKAIAKESIVEEPTSFKFTTEHHLGNTSTVLRSLNSLLKSELIYKKFTTEGKPQYRAYDVLFQRWAELY